MRCLYYVVRIGTNFTKINMRSLQSYPELDLKLKNPFTMLVCGPSSCGKTTFVQNLLLNGSNLYNKKPGKVFWCYKVWQKSYDLMLQMSIVDHFHHGLPTMDWLQENIGDKNLANCTLIIDDMALEATEDTAKIFTVGSHHFNTNVIIIAQNIFTKNKFFREISLNTSYHVLFKNPRDNSSIGTLAQQFAPNNTKDIKSIFKKATVKPHSYLLLDYRQDTNEKHRMRGNIMCESGNPVAIYVLNSI